MVSWFQLTDKLGVSEFLECYVEKNPEAMFGMGTKVYHDWLTLSATDHRGWVGLAAGAPCVSVVQLLRRLTDGLQDVTLESFLASNKIS